MREFKYCSYEYVGLLESHKIKISISSIASPYENATIESFFRTLKVEEVYLWEYETFQDVMERIPYFIEDVYDTKRLHSWTICPRKSLNIYLLKKIHVKSILKPRQVCV